MQCRMMLRLAAPGLLTIIVLGLSGCAKEKGGGDLDVTPPSAVRDLRAISPTPSSIHLDWTAPGSDSVWGTASAYDIRYSTRRFTEENWDSVTRQVDAPPPLEGGSAEHLLVDGLAPESTYYFGLRAIDGAGNWSGLSKLAACMTTSYELVRSWGIGSFRLGRGLAVSSSGIVYVSDAVNDRILKFGSDSTLLDEWRSIPESCVPTFDGPDGLAVDGSGNVYVADTMNDRILKLTSDGALIQEWGGQCDDAHEFYHPQSVAVDAAGWMYVADTNNHRIQRFTPGGNLDRMWGSYGVGIGQFAYPRGVATDAAGNVYVADTDNHRVQVFAADSTFLEKWGTRGWQESQFDYPRRLAITGGSVYVADTNNNRIQEFGLGGEFRAMWGGYGSGDGEFDLPNDVGVDSEGAAHVLDTHNRRVQVFRLTRE